MEEIGSDYLEKQMLCDCFGDIIRVELCKLKNGKRVKTGQIVRICNRCGFSFTEKEYQAWVLKSRRKLNHG